ncbi:DMT family transporter [Cyanobium sp. WAJ14-Wanaka]|uniref:DMT family transporter n=1 Tax=Cyanobium sp. WAJ14-Wanaka TaxID=2823725 RepID=UPI0020CCE9B3|nr:DMT family transporter [Cyanobium sp. WAJ14-Wanaka]MCP9774849.1 DMT family transporter [Cyanobium sp. WAJ14-Wanaka]
MALFILLRGSDSTLLKFLQQTGEATHAAGGPEAISFCNVFFFSSLVTGLVLLLANRQNVQSQLPLLSHQNRWLLVLQSFSGFFLGPMAFFLALARLTVVQQTLLFSLTVPATALLARLLLKEPLPRTFAPSVVLLSTGLLLAMHPAMAGAMAAPVDAHLDPRGLFWALLGVGAFGFSSVVNRLTGQRGLGVGFTVGISSLAASVAFAVIALLLFGPSHFIYLRSWWVLGVIGGYALVISLGSQWSLMQCYRRLSVVQVSLWASLTIVVSLAEAHLVLDEPLHWPALVGAALILVAIGLQPWNSRVHGDDRPGQAP